MSTLTIEGLLKEYEAEMMRDRRSVRRKPFVRPILLTAGRNRDEVHEVFSRDICVNGIGIISRIEWSEGTRARMSIHSINNKQTVTVDAEARWSAPYGKGWFISGWNFIR